MVIHRTEAPLPHVALVMVAVGDLSGSGGAERQFSDLHEYMRRQGHHTVTLVTARASIERLRAAGRLTTVDGVVALRLGKNPARGRLGVAWMTVVLFAVLLRHRFDLIHVCLPTPSYVPLVALLTRLPRGLRPRVVVNVIDCTVAHNLESGTPADRYEQQVLAAHQLYLRWTRLDGIYTWYRAFADVCRTHRLVTPRTTVRAARFCFTSPDRFQPATTKRDVVVFAGRFSEQKRPLVFVDAVASLHRRFPELVVGWRFEMYGGGELDTQVREQIERLGLTGLVSVQRTPDMAPVFAQSRLFVSTQALENFTSLAMMEAMATGNAVIAEDVGQTREFVHDAENGFLVTPGTPEMFADAMARYLRCRRHHDAMARASRRIATEVHTIENFAEDIASFWREVMVA